MKCDGLNCNDMAKYSITYDTGSSNEPQSLKICLKHYQSNSVFQKHISKITEVQE